MLQSETAEAARLAETVREYAVAANDRVLAAVAASVVSAAVAYLGRPDEAEARAREAIHYAREADLPWVQMLSLGTLGTVALGRGDVLAADEFIHTGLRIAQDGFDPWTHGIALNNIGDLIRARGGSAAAGPAYEQAMELFEAMDPRHKYIPQGLLHNLGYVALARGDPRRAAQLFLESADIYRAVGTDRRGLAECTIGLACTAVRAERSALAARLFGAADAELERVGTLLTHANRLERDRGLAELETAVGKDELIAGRCAGREVSLEDALAEARVLVQDDLASAAMAPRGRVGELTAREDEVARLMARGFSNRQIADELVIAEKTVKNYVQRVLEKLEVRSRAELAARAGELGLAPA
jgi:non-specific serine/threonine protein kinase